MKTQGQLFALWAIESHTGQHGISDQWFTETEGRFGHVDSAHLDTFGPCAATLEWTDS